MKLLNIYNEQRKIYLFLRDEEGKQTIREDNSFFPYFYEFDSNGKFKSYDGKSMRKIFVSKPSDVPKRRSEKAHEADILFTKRYILDRVKEIEKTTIKYAFIDIEVLADEMPNVNRAKYPVSCISVYNSMSDSIQTWWLPDYESEYKMLENFMDYMKKEKFDLWLSWNVDFDYLYLYNRVPDFANKISPIGKARYGKKDVLYPAGTSIVDYLAWDKKATLNRRKSYALDFVAQEELKEETWGETNFGKLTEDIKNKNINDVKRMVKIEKKKKYIPYFDEIRRMTKIEWEDIIWNSRMIDMLLLQEAKDRKIALPMKPSEDRNTLSEKEEYEGAYREAYELGSFYGIGKYDLSSAYPYAIIDFCLDPINALNEAIKNNREDIIKIEDSYFIQNENAILPAIVKKLIALKGQIKKQLEATPLNTSEYKIIKMKYDAIKTIVNSSYGVFGNRFFRLYDKRVASATTFLVRDLLHYIKNKIENVGYKVIYIDTDGIFIKSKKNISNKLNDLIQEWAKTKYNKQNVNTEFTFEGIYEALIILAKCRYKGWLKTDKGIETEVKGIEAKRKDSTVFTKNFQTELLDKIKDKESKETIIQWINEKNAELKKASLTDIAIPCKLSRDPSEYKTEIIRDGKVIKRKPYITVRALQNAQELMPSFKKKVGQRYYYIYTKKDEESIVMAFDENNQKHITNVDYDLMIDRNILNKAEVVFKAMGWYDKKRDKIKFLELFKKEV